ncbi:Sin3 associated polypeptide p18-domain-containing protein, partial [Crucibulum laeve]
KTAPFLIRTFVKIGGFHRITLFEDGTLPTTDEQQIFTWRDAKLREVLTTLRNTAPHVAEYRHPLARFFFRTVYADSSNRGRFTSRDLGQVYSRDILGEPGTLNTIAPSLRDELEPEDHDHDEKNKTLDDLRFLPGDYLCVSVVLPKSVTVPGELSIKGSGAPGATPSGWRGGAGAGPAARGDGGWGGSVAAPPAGRGGGHWRGSSDGPPPPAGGRGGRGGRGRGDFGRDRDRDRDDDRRVPPPRRGGDSPPPRGGGWGRGGRGGRRSRSRSRSPPPRRRGRYD